MPTIGHARQAIADAQARAELYRMWHTAQRAGLTHAHSLDTMGVRTGSKTVEMFRTRLLEGTRQRRTLASIVEQHKQLTQPFESALLSVGEESGSLDRSLATLAAHFAAEQRLLRKVWSKLTYPLITSLAALLIAPLPLLVAGNTKAYLLIVVTEFAVWYAFGGSVIAALAAKYANRREFVLARLARALATGVEAALPLDRIVTLAAASTGHPQIIAHVRAQTLRRMATQPISETLSGCAVIPTEMLSAIRIAEVSGDFSTGLRKLAELYDGNRA